MKKAPLCRSAHIFFSVKGYVKKEFVPSVSCGNLRSCKSNMNFFESVVLCAQVLLELH